MEALFRKILCPIDFDRISIPALTFARNLARQNDATVYLLYVVSKRRSAPVEPGVEQFARDNLRAVARKWFEGKVRYEIDLPQTLASAGQEIYELISRRAKIPDAATRRQ